MPYMGSLYWPSASSYGPLPARRGLKNGSLLLQVVDDCVIYDGFVRIPK